MCVHEWINAPLGVGVESIWPPLGQSNIFGPLLRSVNFFSCVSLSYWAPPHNYWKFPKYIFYLNIFLSYSFSFSYGTTYCCTKWLIVCIFLYWNDWIITIFVFPWIEQKNIWCCTGWHCWGLWGSSCDSTPIGCSGGEGTQCRRHLPQSRQPSWMQGPHWCHQ